ncbi:MAG: sensor histidine kinase [Lachnospiraceae bacterium]|nr:sensor histidine kinase [Lachnospiraceae bacterium]
MTKCETDTKNLLLGINEDIHECKEALDRIRIEMQEATVFIERGDREHEDDFAFNPRSSSERSDTRVSLYKEKLSNLKKQDVALTERLDKLMEYRDRLERISKAIKPAKEKSNLSKMQVLEIQEKERQRMARDLHDGPLQNLTNLIHRLELVKLYFDTGDERAMNELSASEDFLRETINEMRDELFEFRPMSIEDLGLEDTLLRLTEQMKENINRFCPSMMFHQEIKNVSCENPLVIATVYRSLRECLLNAIKYSKAKNLTLKAGSTDEAYKFVVQDDGTGFDPKHYDDDHHFGLKIVKERVSILGGKLTIASKDGSGTKITITIPVESFE